MRHKRWIYGVSLLLGLILTPSISEISFKEGITLNIVHAETNDERQVRLQAELAKVEEEQRQTEKVLLGAQQESASLERDIRIVNTKIRAAELNIQAKNLLIATLGRDITQKTKTIGTLNDRIDRGQESLSQILRKTHEIDSYTLPEIMLSQDTVAGFFADIDDFESVRASLKGTFDDIRTTRTQTESERTALDKKKNAELDAKAVIAQEKKNIQAIEAEKSALLSSSKSSEKYYGQVLADKKKKAAEIRAALFSLRDAEAIPFEKALQYANEASRATGVRPAFVLAILTQESSLGKNVGTCYLANTDTGAGVSVKSGTTFKNVMKPSRDVGPFIEITRELGLDPFKTLVSCPQSIGWGGAMGPAQFIASTWKLFIARLKSVLGVSVADPWNPRHAFMASAMYLGDLGAAGGSYTGERNAACKYYSGKTCTTGNINVTYGNQVMVKAATIQTTMIDPLQGI